MKTDFRSIRSMAFAWAFIASFGFTSEITASEILYSSPQSDDQGIWPTVIYGDDDRLDIYQVENEAVLKLASSTVALVQEEKFQIDQSSLLGRLLGPTFGDSYGLCHDEPFREQKTSAFCSGSLIAKDIILTAGHCITDLADCQNTRFIFDFAITEAGQTTPHLVAPENAYQCSELIHRTETRDGADFALIRLDRPVEGREPLAIRREGSPAVGQNLLVIGHPAGLPTKVAGGATIRRIMDEHFVANLDTYGGNSGSAVFDEETGLIEGILVRGEVDFVYRGSCRVSRRCTPTGCMGEDATLVSEILPYLPAEQAP